MTQSYENIQLALGQKWLNQYCGSIPGYIQVPETGGYDTIGKTIIGVLTALQKNIGVSTASITQEYNDISHVFGNKTMTAFGDYSLSVNTDFSSEYNLNMLKILQMGLWCKGFDPGAFGVATSQLTTAINGLMSEAGILPAEQDGVASRMIFIAVSTEVDFTIAIGMNGSNRVRMIQQTINAAYGKERNLLVPCDGIRAVSTIAGFLYYYQRKVGLTQEEAANAYGLYNRQTYEVSPILEEGNSSEMVQILNSALYLINGYNSPDSSVFGEETQEIVKKLQLSVGLKMTGIVDKLTWGYVLESCGYQETLPNACDTSMKLGTSEINILKANNIKVVGRYLTGMFAMSPDEIFNITSNNIAVIPIFEYGNTLDYFTFEQGQKDASAAAMSAENLGILADNSVTIYFAVDNDFTLDNLTGPIAEYFRGVFTQMTQAKLGYNIGVYGARYTCTYLLKQGYVSSSYVAGASYEFILNMGYPMPAIWGFNQYSTENINAEGVGSTIYLDGAIPIDKVNASGSDQGVRNVNQNGKIASVSKENSIITNNTMCIEQANSSNYPLIRTTAIEILSSILNIKTTDLLKLIPRTLEEENGKGKKPFATWGPVYIPGTNQGIYLRGDFGLKLQGASGSNDVIYLNKGDSKYSLDPSVDYLPISFDKGNAYLGSNIHPKVLANAESSSAFLQSVAPTLAQTVFKYKNWTVGIQYYSCWDGNEEALDGYYELGFEIGINTPTKEMPFIDVPYGAYFFVDIIMGVSIEAFKSLLQKIDDNFNLDDGVFNLMNKLCDKIKSVPKTISSKSDGDATETEDMNFEGDTPEIFEDFGAFEESGGAEAEWEVFAASLEAALPEGLLLLVCF